MNTPERLDGPPAPWNPEPTAAAVFSPQRAERFEYAEPAGEPAQPRAITLRIIARAIRRRWWLILPLWLGASAAFMYVAMTKVRPSYEAVAGLKIEPPPGGLFVGGGAPASLGTFESQLETQVQLVLTPDVLGEAIQTPDVARLPRIKTALDPVAELRRDLRVQVTKNTRFITVSMTTPSSEEGVVIVNAVAKAYKEKAANLASEDIQRQIKHYETVRDTFKAQVETKEKEVRRIGRVAHEGALGKDKDPNEDASVIKRINNKTYSISMEEFRRVSGVHQEIELALVEAQTTLEHLQAQNPASKAAVRLEEAVEAAWQSDPDVMDIAEEHALTKRRKDAALASVRGPGDPAVRNYQKRLDDLKLRYDGLVARKKPAVREKVKRDLADDSVMKEIQDTKLKIAALNARKAALEKDLERIKVDSKAAENDRLDIDLALSDLHRSQNMLEEVTKRLESVHSEAQQGQARIAIFPARNSRLPTSDHRSKLMAAAPVGTLLIVLSLFVLLEAKAGRVADPDELSLRVRQLEVIGVVPPLPSSRPARALPWGDGAARAQRHVEEFVQSLDHLRVALWAGPRPGAGNRCVLITSACGSEGKTTLAAQLAGRCANAGLMTLLVDADLRRPALGALLEVPEGPGLADVLAGDVEPEAAMVVIGNAGGFHLLPAGTTGQDPSRLLHGDRLGHLLARFRETFDIVIVDAPPVLAVPDALILGRWTDGAVLAVRHDMSRYPLVERAHQRLAAVGVPILGAVVNGCRTVDSAYSNYSYATPPEGRGPSA